VAVLGFAIFLHQPLFQFAFCCYKHWEKATCERGTTCFILHFQVTNHHWRSQAVTQAVTELRNHGEMLPVGSLSLSLSGSCPGLRLTQPGTTCKGMTLPTESWAVLYQSRQPLTDMANGPSVLVNFSSLFFSFLLNIFFIYISNVIPFHGSPPPGNPLSHPPSPCFSEGIPPPTHPIPPPHLLFPYTGASIKPS
jgi:hypothetical protein